VIRIGRPRSSHPCITVEAWCWQPARQVFALESAEAFGRGAEGWARD